jgi:hypothetical protein
VGKISLGLIREQQFHHHALRRLGALTTGVHLHVRGGLAKTRGREHPFSLYLHHTRSAVAV